MHIVKRIPDGEQFPKFYGEAWYDMRRREVVCLPVGMNKLAGFARACWWYLMKPSVFMMTAQDRIDLRNRFDDLYERNGELELEVWCLRNTIEGLESKGDG